MKRDDRLLPENEKKTGFSEKEFMDYLEERFRKLRMDEQKFRDEVLTKHSLLDKNSGYTKIAR